MSLSDPQFSPVERVAGSDPAVLLLCDHASNAIPPDVALGIDPALLTRHIAYDIGARALTLSLCRLLSARAVLGGVSRLVVDLHRAPDQAGLIPLHSDGHHIPGNADADAGERIARFHAPFHATIDQELSAHRPDLIVSIHSFTARLEQEGDTRPWEAGVLYNRDIATGQAAIGALRAQGIVTGDNQPYSGNALNATLDRHAAPANIPSVLIEVRNDLIAEDDGTARWSGILAEVIAQVRNGLARSLRLAT